MISYASLCYDMICNSMQCYALLPFAMLCIDMCYAIIWDAIYSDTPCCRLLHYTFLETNPPTQCDCMPHYTLYHIQHRFLLSLHRTVLENCLKTYGEAVSYEGTMLSLQLSHHKLSCNGDFHVKRYLFVPYHYDFICGFSCMMDASLEHVIKKRKA